MVAKRRSRVSRKAGAPPGTLLHVGEQREHPVSLTVMQYDAAGQFREWQPADPAELATLADSSAVSWINVDGIHETSVVARLGEVFRIHPLILEDIVHAGQRPKLEDLGESLYLVIRMLSPGGRDDEPEWEQLSMVLGPRYLLSFQEKPGGDFFDPVRQRIRENRGRIRRAGADYLAHALIDLVVDRYFVVLEPLGDRIEALEDDVVRQAAPEGLGRINQLRRTTADLRRSVWPLREVVSQLQRSESPLISHDTRPYLRDVHDHVIQIVETVEIQREMLGGMMELYLTGLSHRMNEIMKVLTIIATVFIPLTFLVGVYGMNFRYMPELQWRYGYFAVWVVMLLAAGGMLYYFRRKRWF